MSVENYQPVFDTDDTSPQELEPVRFLILVDSSVESLAELPDQELEEALERKAEELGLDPENPDHLELIKSARMDDDVRDTLEEEIELANKRGDFKTTDSLKRYLNDLGKVKLLTRSQELALSKEVEKGNSDAKEHMIVANLRLVVSIATKYDSGIMPLLDLIQEGNIGLIKAVERYDWRMGNKFSTYATWCIRQSIFHAIDEKSRIIRKPAYMIIRYNTINKTARELTIKNGRYPTDAEIGEEVGLSEEAVIETRRFFEQPLSLEQPSMPGDRLNAAITRAETVADNSPGTDQQAMNTLQREKIAGFLLNLPEDEREIIVSRFGLDGTEPKTLAELGRQMGVTRERVRQKEERCLEKLRELAASHGITRDMGSQNG